MNKAIIAILVIVLLVAAGYWYVTTNQPTAENGTPPPSAPTTKTYNASAYGFSFDYPTSYSILSEGKAGDGASAHNIVVFSETTEVPVNGEGPTAIVVQIFPKPANTTLLDWLTEESATNFNLSSTGRTEPITIGGKQAIRYNWSGLYEADAVAFEHGSTYVVMSATWMTQTDAIRTDFNDVIASLRFTSQ